MNKGNFKFEVEELPIEAQFSTVYAITAHDFDNDGDNDLVLGGNLYNVKPEVGRYDASYGLYLENDSKGNFTVPNDNGGFKVQGEVRNMVLDGNKLLISRSRDSLVLFKFGNENRR
jgi:hypothetical protein